MESIGRTVQRGADPIHSSYRYYRSEDDHENQYYEGVYEVYYGQTAVDKVVSMTEYGLTEEELNQVLSANMNGYVPGGSTC